jgi:uncharacterized protein YqiB (DUF1249 family)
MPRSPKWSLSLRFPPPKHCIRFSSPHTRYMPSPSHSSRLYHANNTGEEYRSFKQRIMLHYSFSSENTQNEIITKR